MGGWFQGRSGFISGTSFLDPAAPGRAHRGPAAVSTGTGLNPRTPGNGSRHGRYSAAGEDSARKGFVTCGGLLQAGGTF